MTKMLNLLTISQFGVELQRENKFTSLSFSYLFSFLAEEQLKKYCHLWA